MERRETFGKFWDGPQERSSAPSWRKAKRRASSTPDTPTPIMLSVFWGMLSPQHFSMLIVEKQMSSDLVVAHLSRCFFKGIAPGGGACPAVQTESVSEGSTPA